jgi:hypothetical protein
VRFGFFKVTDRIATMLRDIVTDAGIVAIAAFGAGDRCQVSLGRPRAGI